VPYLARFLLIVLACITFATSFAQDTTVQANIVVTNLFDPRPDYLVFEIDVRRVSDQWLLWSDATIRLWANEGLGVVSLDSAQYSIAYVPGTSVLPVGTYAPAAMSAYTIDPQLDTTFVTIAVHGPDQSGSAFAIPLRDSLYRLGRFEIRRLDGGNAPSYLSIVDTRGYRYQANAFKMDHDSVTGSGAEREVWYQLDDNVEMNTIYSITQRGAPCSDLTITEFTGEYIGDLRVRLRFVAECEMYTRGYFIERAIVTQVDPANLSFEPLPSLTYTTNPLLVACSTCVSPTIYENFIDDVLYRRTLYAYRVASVARNSDVITYHDTIFVRVPNAIISNAKLLENPFRDRTTVQFNIDDRLTLTVAAYDVGGRLISYLNDEKGNPIISREYPQGAKYEAKFEAPEVASQSMYNIVFLAVPINDRSVEDLSRVVIKAQLLK